MAKIHILDQHEIQKIAAGEVIERPAHIVKELCENAFDAGATSIIIFLENAGKKSIRVRDNGCGMSAEDAMLCVKHHATSKITTIHDLDSLQTYGFRGEALSSISSVSEVHIQTAEKETDGFFAQFSFGTLQEHGLTSCTKGTEITISHLFEHLPARKKFLRSDTTELNTILHSIHACAFSHPHCSLRVFHNDKLLYDVTTEQSLIDRAITTWGHHTQNTLRPLHFKKEGYNIEGLITGPAYQRYDRNNIYFFVNGRWIKNTKLFQALLKAYATVLPHGRFPAGIITLTVPIDLIDINVHPRKEEVSFLHPRIIEKMITECAAHALRNYHHVPQPVPSAIPWVHSSFEIQNEFPSIQEQIVVPSVVPEIENQFKIISQYALTYIFIEKEESIVVLDQHAVHERVLYDQLQSNTTFESVSLIFPIVVTLPADYHTQIMGHIKLFNQCGLQIEECGENIWAIHSLPIILKHVDGKSLLLTLLQNLAESPQDLLHTIHATIACKAAVKAGDTMSVIEMEELVKKWYSTPHKFTCPHGRPTLWELPLRDLAKKFKRYI